MGYFSFKFGHIIFDLLLNVDDSLSVVVFYIYIVHRNEISEATHLGRSTRVALPRVLSHPDYSA